MLNIFQPERFHNNWIVHGTLWNNGISGNPPSYLILTAHNVVFNVSTCPSAKILNIFECPNENSILYSGTIVVLKEKVLVAAGTVLDGVVLWDMKAGSVLNNFKSHEGSILG